MRLTAAAGVIAVLLHEMRAELTDGHNARRLADEPVEDCAAGCARTGYKGDVYFRVIYQPRLDPPSRGAVLVRQSPRHFENRRGGGPALSSTA
jgi:hypothetical protein